ncbi:MAG: alpha/beta fold hydrolase, partial [Anaerolineales bacterium]
ERTALAGHSMGGYVALAFARRYPQHVSALALVASHPYADPPDRREARYTTARAVAEQGVAVVANSMPEKLTANPTLQHALRDLALRQSPAGVIGALRAMAARPDSMDLLRGFDFPLVVVQGAQDSIIPVQFGRDVQAAHPNAHVVELPAAGHMPMMEAPRETAEALLKLLP